MITNQDVSSYLQERRRAYENDTTYAWDGLGFSQRDTLKQIDFYKSSKFLDGDYDEHGNALIFNNIVNTAADTAKTYQDIDQVDLELTAVEGSRIQSKLLNKENHKLMEEIRMGALLNRMTDVRVDYGGVFVRKRMVNGKLKLEVPDMKDLMFNSQDWKRDAVVQRTVISPAELHDKIGVWDNAQEIIDEYNMQQAANPSLSKDIVTYEIFGYLPEQFGKENGEVYSDKNVNKVVVSIGFQSTVAVTRPDNAVEYQVQDTYHTVFEGKIKEVPFKYLPYKVMPGRTLGQGVIEAGFMAQMGTNRALYEQMTSMSVAGKVFMQTSSEELDVESLADAPSGTIVRHEVNRPITNLNVTPTALPMWDNLMGTFKAQYDAATSVNPFTAGGDIPSRTSFNTTELMQQVGTKSFNQRKQEMDLFLREIYQDWLMPYFIENITDEHILDAEFTKEELEELDETWATKQIDKQVAEFYNRTGKIPSEEEVNRGYDKLIRNARLNGEKRMIKITKDFFEDVKANVRLNVTNENMNKEAMMSSLTNIFQVLLQNPMALQDEQLSAILNELLEYAGVSSVRIAKSAPTRKNSIAAKMGAMSGSGSGAVAAAIQNGAV